MLYEVITVKLFVVRRDPGLQEDALKAYCKENLTSYKCPKYIEFRDELSYNFV